MSNPPLRILLLIKSLGQGGAERQCCVLAGQLAEAGHSVCVVVYDNPDGFYRPLLPVSVRLVSLHCGRWNIPGLIFGLWCQIRAFKPDVIYGFMSHSNLLVLFSGLFTQARRVCGIRGSNYDLNTEKVQARLGEWLHRFALRFADLVIANSDAGMHELRDFGLPDGKITVVSNGIDCDRFRFSGDARVEIRSRLGYSADDRVIGLFARLHAMKGHAVLLEAFSAAVSEDRNFKLLLIGSGDRTPIEKAISELRISESVMLMEERPDIERYYSAIDMYCSSSLYGEGFPNALSEAMSTGLPCIATDVGDSGLIISDFGTLVAAGDVQQLSAAILSCSTVRNEVDTEARRQHIVRNFGIGQFGERTIAALRKTLES